MVSESVGWDRLHVGRDLDLLKAGSLFDVCFSLPEALTNSPAQRKL
jgi:hypothetical protein